MGRHQLKGFVEPVAAWRVEGSQNTELRFDKRRRGTLAPLVGRDQEFDLLRARWQAACQGEGQAVFLSGEAGLGKSRLAEEIYRQLVQGNAQRLSFQCSPYHENSAFHPMKTHFGYAIGLDDSDTPEAQKDKLQRFFSSQGHEAEAFLPEFCNFLSAGKQEEDTETSPEEAKGRITESLLSYIELLSRRQPLLILFEDLHWIDPSSEALLSLLIDRLDDMRVMVLGTYRPEFSPRWYGDSKTTILSLARLNMQDTRNLLAALSTSDRLLENIEAAVVSHSEGVPLFVEEMVSMLQSARSDSMNDQALFPSNLKDLLRARLDHLSVTPDTVSICAALDRSFTAELVAAMAERMVPEVSDELTRLVQAQILVTEPQTKEGRFSFRHALLRDAAYDAILPQKARHLHHRIADTMRLRFARYCERNPEILALHYRKAEQHAAARELWHKAALLSLRNYASHEAVAHLTAALEAHGDLDRDETSDTREIELRQDMFVALEMRGWGSPDIGVNLERLIALKEKTGDKEVAFISLNHLVGENLIAGRPDIALDHCAQMAALIQADPSPTFHTLCHHYRGMSLLLLGEFDRAIQDFDLALGFQKDADPDELHRYYPANTAVIDAVMRCWARALKHMTHDVIADELGDAITLARAENSEFTRCFALCIIATIYCVVDEPEKSHAFADETYRISDKIELRYWEAWSSVVLGWAEAKCGNPEKGIERLRAGLERYVASGSGMLVAFSHTLLADACLSMDEVSEAANQIKKARQRLDGSAIGFHRVLTEKIARDVGEQGRAGQAAQ